jgi:hypothetical protein
MAIPGAPKPHGVQLYSSRASRTPITTRPSQGRGALGFFAVKTADKRGPYQENSSMTGLPPSISFIGRCNGVMTSLLGLIPKAWQTVA